MKSVSITILYPLVRQLPAVSVAEVYFAGFAQRGHCVIPLQVLVPFFQNYGYIAVFGMLILCGFGLPVPEDITLVSGGIIAGLGYANPHMMFALSMAGVLIGDGVIYQMGKRFGEPFLDKRVIGKLISHERVHAVLRWLDQYGAMLIFAARFMPGLRAPIFFATGSKRIVSFPAFVLIDSIAAFISVPVWVYLGFFGASNREWLLKWISRSKYGFLGLAAAVVLFVLMSILIKKKIKKLDAKISGGTKPAEARAPQAPSRPAPLERVKG
jgi:membrane protein DedA with SNARE-associated domain